MQRPDPLAVLPIDEVTLPADDVSDLKDVFDAINRLCETMKTSRTGEDNDAPQSTDVGEGLVSPAAPDALDDRCLQVSGSEGSRDWAGPASQFVSAEDLSIQRMETQRQKWRESQASLASSEAREPAPDAWSDTQASPPSDARVERWSDCCASPPALADPTSDVYYTASSEVSLLSDSEPERLPLVEGAEREEGAECVMAGHVAAMRERFESMTRANTPCPDPALDSLRNITPSPDLLG